MRLSRTLFFLLLLLLPSLAFCEGAPEFLKLGHIKPLTLHVGKASHFVIPVEVTKGFHIQANPASEKNLIPTTLDIKPANGVTIEKVSYPKGEAYRLQSSDRDISAYEGKVEIKVLAKAVSANAPSELQGKLKFQACNDKTCFFPTSVPVTVPVKVVR